MNNLKKIRVKSFFVELTVLIGAGLGGVLLSPEFLGLVTKHFGDTALVGLGMLVLTGVVKHLINLRAVKKLGSDQEILLI